MDLQLPFRPAMKLLLALGFAVSLLGQPIAPVASGAAEEASVASLSDPNVNSRYTIESINFVDNRQYKLSPSVLEEMHRLVGAKVSTAALDRLSQRLRADLRAYQVTFKIARGATPDQVRVLIHVDHAAGVVQASIPKFVYNSQEGLSAEGEVDASSGPNELAVRMLRDNDTLIEQYSGIQASYDRFALAGGRVRLGFEFDAYADQYDPATIAALGAESRPSSPGAGLPAGLGAGAYGSRLNYEPSATFVLAAPLTLTVGLGFEQLNGLPSIPGSLSDNLVISSLRYHQRWTGANGVQQEVDAGYSLRAATAIMASNLAYTRHLADAHYTYTRDAQSIEVTMVAGAILGDAPLFERFALGDSVMLRGWDKYELDPLGGNRLAYGSVTYGYHIMRVFYDAGSVWDRGNPINAEQSAGVGVSGGLGVFERGAFLLAVAFPLRQDHLTPVLIAGMNF